MSVRDVGVLSPNGWTDQDETWLADRPRPWPDCVSIVAKRSPISATAELLYMYGIGYFEISQQFITTRLALPVRLASLYNILNAVRCPYERSSVTLGVARSVANDVIMRMTSQ